MSFAGPFLGPTTLSYLSSHSSGLLNAQAVLFGPLALHQLGASSLVFYPLAPLQSFPQRPRSPQHSTVPASPLPAFLSPASQPLSLGSYCSAGAMCDPPSGSTGARTAFGVAGAGRSMAWAERRGAEAARASPGSLRTHQCPPSIHQEYSPTAIHGLGSLSRDPQLLLLYQPDSHIRLQQRLCLPHSALGSLPSPGPLAQLLLLAACATCPEQQGSVGTRLRG